MYADTTHVRNERVNLSFTKKERRALEALAELNECQPSAFMRGLFHKFVEEHAPNFREAFAEKRATQ